ncbi:hypothetical protein G7009_08490 [Pseudomonas capeferrum]|uniref:hypothetical protein n=1 Tax=Pseudomonas capeferrum TaxID=1495066 RepID=UPI0015E32C5A|nr:hypothetical protein [Pseudomonas capeferrum]MBA1201797.1 hypothetical protein [Pseudomonas capeferrum]
MIEKRHRARLLCHWLLVRIRKKCPALPKPKELKFPAQLNSQSDSSLGLMSREQKMNNRNFMLCVFAAFLPLSAGAAEVEMEKNFNGLDITTQIAGDNSSGPGSSMSGLQVMKVTNNTSSQVRCELEAGPAEASDSVPGPVMIKPHESATLRLPGSYASATFKAKLTCDKA